MTIDFTEIDKQFKEIHPVSLDEDEEGFYCIYDAGKVKSFLHIAIEEAVKKSKSGDLVSNCCAWDFDPFGYEKDEGVWQERCLKCNKLCETLYISKQDIKNIHNLDSLTQEEKKP